MNPTESLDGAVPLTHLGAMRARGADAVKFLQGQLTNDVATIASDRARLAGFCSAKGRLQASFVVCHAAPDELLLVCAASVLPATLKRLSMFVMRARCKLSDAGDSLAIWGVAGSSAHALLADAAVWSTRQAGDATLIRLPDVDGVARALWLRPASHDAESLPAIALDAWRRLEVRSGLPTIEAATVDQFVPQMLNYEIVGGVDFKKGCYPGQEVVARSQYRGTIKRRMFLFDCDAEATPSQDVFHSADAAQPAGMVVNAAASAAGGSTALVEVKWAALDAGTLHLGKPDGAVLHRATLPYDVPFDSPAER